MFRKLLRSWEEALRRANTPHPDLVAREIESAIEAIEQSIAQIRRDFGIAEQG